MARMRRTTYNAVLPHTCSRQGRTILSDQFIVMQLTPGLPAYSKALIGKNHPEFSSGRQQDAAEFVQYFLEQLARVERTSLGSLLKCKTLNAITFYS
eukprot:1929063-Amphidinium_carterae.1